MLGKLERRFGRFAIPNVTLIFIAGQVVALFAGLGDPQILSRIDGNVAEIFGGEWYRLLTFLWMPPGSHPIWAFFFWYMFYMMEHHWSSTGARFAITCSLLIGYAANVAAALLFPADICQTGFCRYRISGLRVAESRFHHPDLFRDPRSHQMDCTADVDWFSAGLCVWSDLRETFYRGIVLNFLSFFGKDLWYRIRSGQRQMADRFGALQKSHPSFFTSVLFVASQTRRIRRWIFVTAVAVRTTRVTAVNI